MGFNPLIYDFKNPVQQGVFRDPLSAFLNKGSPAGPWLHRVFEPSLQSEPSRLKAAIHGHFHYPELLGEFLRSLEINQSRPDLFITTTSETARVEINRELERSGWSAFEVWVVPNQGRDIFPFIKELPARLGKNYDIVGHLHGKKSKHLPLQMGTRWRNFAWQHLVGDQHPMVDTILAAFAKHPDIGLVFPEDPHLFGWEVNEESATRLAVSMGIAIPLPIHFDFPVGTMFWARPDALQPLFELDLDLSEIPAEPLALDGTTLHALERLIPMVVAKAGFEYATTHVSGINR
ncbi:MAG: rhamnan synthesis F family protein [Rhizobiaceae bacterium]|nr:rhamnan synthesis F family protein [Rhizobiaceae bacterium]